jgi:hypothetical protein
METQRIPAKSGASFRVAAGAAFEVATPAGRQVADLVAFGPDGDPFSQAYTRDLNGRIRISTGDALYTESGEAVLTIADDDCGVHDIMFGPCTAWMLTDRRLPDGEVQNEPGGCRENLALALEPHGFDESDVPDTMNVFQRSTVTDQTYFDVRESPADPGDAVRFRAETDALVAVSACSARGVASGDEMTPIDLRAPEGADVTLASVQPDRP